MNGDKMHGIMPRKSLTSSDSKAIVPELKMVVHTQVNHYLGSRGLRKTPGQWTKYSKITN